MKKRRKFVSASGLYGSRAMRWWNEYAPRPARRGALPADLKRFFAAMDRADEAAENQQCSKAAAPQLELFHPRKDRR
jgi:hypothetical protein